MMGQLPRMESLFYYFRLEDQIPEDHLLTKAETVLQLIHILRGSLHVTFEEGTCATWLHDLLLP